jgi:hypothetical protein
MSYPLTYPDNGDARFTGELIDEIGAVLTAHGYPSVDGDDTAFAGLREALRGFLYGPEFDRGDEVTWFRNGKVWSGRIEFIANTDGGPVARVRIDPQQSFEYRGTDTVVPCRELTPVRDGV